MSDSCLLTYMKKKTYAFSFHKVCTFLLFSSPFPPLLSFESKLFNQDANCPSYRGAPFLFLIAHLLQRKRKRRQERTKDFFSEKNLFFFRRELKYFYGAELTGTAGEFDVFNVSKKDTSLAMLETSKVSFDICINILFLPLN